MSPGMLKQEFVVGGYRPDGANGVDALLVGYYEAKELRFAGKVRAGMVPHTRRELASKLKPLRITACPFSNLPDSDTGRWGGGVTADQMAVRGTRTCRTHRFSTRSFCRVRRQTALRGRRLNEISRELREPASFTRMRV
jgi:ATP-dependent DNA ligase